jgi:Haem-binding domain
MSWIKKIMIIVLVALVGIQFFPANRNQSDIVPDTDFNKIYNVPENFKTIFKTSCYDCHSNNTNYPWYNKIQPITWFLEDHIAEGKAELNFSTFNEYSKRRQRNKLKSIISQIEKDEMPLASYTFIHGDAKLTDKEKNELLVWLNTLKPNNK